MGLSTIAVVRADRLVPAAASVVSTAPFVPPVDGSLAEPSRKLRQMDSKQETAKMLAAFKELWASG